ncbi:hypothetical protein HDU76_009888 [Blyttiomyces sp. JEL0837]|nr:hypothetical protein HDU76_009888 [Blyttiomyces sp. JEL0837]
MTTTMTATTTTTTNMLPLEIWKQLLILATPAGSLSEYARLTTLNKSIRSAMYPSISTRANCLISHFGINDVLAAVLTGTIEDLPPTVRKILTSAVTLNGFAPSGVGIVTEVSVNGTINANSGNVANTQVGQSGLEGRELVMDGRSATIGEDIGSGENNINVEEGDLDESSSSSSSSCNGVMMRGDGNEGGENSNDDENEYTDDEADEDDEEEDYDDIEDDDQEAAHLTLLIPDPRKWLTKTPSAYIQQQQSSSTITMDSMESMAASKQCTPLALLKTLLRLGASITSHDSIALRVGAQSGNVDLVKMVLDAAKVRGEDLRVLCGARDSEAVREAARRGDFEVVELLVNEGGCKVDARRNEALR